jgi:hypothetical protein
MATQKDTLERLVNKEEIVYWAKKGGVEIESFDGGIYVDDWQINLDTNDMIVSVERRMDESQEL